MGKPKFLATAVLFMSACILALGVVNHKASGYTMPTPVVQDCEKVIRSDTCWKDDPSDCSLHHGNQNDCLSEKCNNCNNFIDIDEYECGPCQAGETKNTRGCCRKSQSSSGCGNRAASNTMMCQYNAVFELCTCPIPVWTTAGCPQSSMYHFQCTPVACE